jgi:predicted nucleotide-binding protein
MIWPSSPAQQKLGEVYALNIDEEQLRERILEPYERGTPLTWAGRTLPAGDFGKVTITQTDSPQQLIRHHEYETVKSGVEVTNDWIKGPPGEAGAEVAKVLDEHRDPKRVMVVHGRNLAMRNAMFTFLRALGLEPIEWEAAVAETGMGSPHNLEAVRAAMDIGQAVIVLLTAEDRAGLLPELAGEGEEIGLQGQPRQNVILEAGLAMGLNPRRTILVELGPIRRASDFDGLNTIRLTNTAATRGALRTRLRNAGCGVAEDGTDWLGRDTGGDFDGYARVEPSRPTPVRAEPPENNPYSRASELQRDHEIKRFLSRHEGVDQPFSEKELSEAMQSADCDEDWAKTIVVRLEGEGWVHRSLDGAGWYPGGK